MIPVKARDAGELKDLRVARDSGETIKSVTHLGRTTTEELRGRESGLRADIATETRFVVARAAK